jgi:hypothetical protein
LLHGRTSPGATVFLMPSQELSDDFEQRDKSEFIIV